MTVSLREIMRAYGSKEMEEPDLSLVSQAEMPIAKRIELILRLDMDGDAKFKRLVAVFEKYRARDLPSADKLGLCRETWMVLYWKMRERELGFPLSMEDRIRDFPAEKSNKAIELMDSLWKYSSSLQFLPMEAIFHWPKEGSYPQPTLAQPSQESAWRFFVCCFKKI